MQSLGSARRTSQRSKGKGSISGVCASNSHRGQRSPSGAKMASRPPPLPRPKKATAHCEHVTFTTWPKWLPKVSISAWAPLTASVVRKVHMGLKRLHDPPPRPWPKWARSRHKSITGTTWPNGCQKSGHRSAKAMEAQIFVISTAVLATLQK